ncbi:hypothetical protein [Amycolatopsis pigmentata]|uniref:Extracellular solute-binding protein n=1 Tax=Amycolatopsis pigmentata TaxID=450801 RepID=A0ABW5FQU5_9PSEU
MGRHSIDEEPPPPSGRRVATGRYPAVDAPVRATGEAAVRPPDGRVSTGHHLAVEARSVVPTPQRPPDRRVATGQYPPADPALQRRDGRRSTGQYPPVDGPPRRAGNPPPRRPAPQPPAVDAPTRQTTDQAPRRPDGRIETGRRPAVDAPARETAMPRRPDGRTATGRNPAVDAPTRQVRNPAPGRPGTRTTGEHPAVDAPTRQVGNPAARRPDRRTATGQQTAVDAPTRQVREPAPRRADGRTTGQHATVDEPTRQVETPQRSDGRSATGYHRAVGAAATRRRIAKWPIVAGVLVLLVAVGLGGWAWANKVLDSRNAAQAKDCAEGVATMKVIVAPGVSRPVQAAAAKWNQARTVVHAHCITVDVQPRPSNQVLDALTGHAAPDTIGGIPAAWVPEATGNWAAQLATARPDLIGTPPEGLTNGFSYVGLGGSAVDEVTIRAAQVFHDFLMDPAQRPDFTDAGLT